MAVLMRINFTLNSSERGGVSLHLCNYVRLCMPTYTQPILQMLYVLLTWQLMAQRELKLRVRIALFGGVYNFDDFQLGSRRLLKAANRPLAYLASKITLKQAVRYSPAFFEYHSSHVPIFFMAVEVPMYTIPVCCGRTGGGFFNFKVGHGE